MLLGQTVYRQLLSETENPIGALVLVKGMPLRVIGLLTAKGQTAFGTDQNDVVMIPFSTGERKVLGVAAPTQQQTPINWAYLPPPNPYRLQSWLTGFVNQIFIQASSQDLVQPAIQQVTDALSRRHHLKPTDLPDFAVRNLSQIAQAAEGSSRIMALLLAAVASISLLVGGIGIMNILLVSVTERTREIGLRMAIGVSVSGGIAGMVTGVIAAGLISIVFGWPAPVSIMAIVAGFSFSAAVGIFFGYYPARKAARLDPMEALRFE